jgi:hypothetical protein
MITPIPIVFSLIILLFAFDLRSRRKSDRIDGRKHRRTLQVCACQTVGHPKEAGLNLSLGSWQTRTVNARSTQWKHND